MHIFSVMSLFSIVSINEYVQTYTGVLCLIRDVKNCTQGVRQEMTFTRTRTERVQAVDAGCSILLTL